MLEALYPPLIFHIVWNRI